MIKNHKSFWLNEVDHVSSFCYLYDQLKDIFFFVKDREGQLVYANQGLVEHYGYGKLDEVLGKTDFDIHDLHIAEKFVKDDQVVMRTGKPLNNLIELFPDRFGIPQLYITNKSPLYDKKRKVCGVCGTVQSYSKSREQLTPYMTMAPATDYIQENYHKSIKSETLAKLVNLSIAQFNRRFKDLFRLTAQAYITRVRLLESCNLLQNTNLNVTEIALQCGFYDHSHYTREFKRAMSLAPNQYRKKNSGHGE